VKSVAGFTILEVLIALLILAVGVLGLVSVAANASRLVAEGRYYSQAVAVASGQLERLHAAGCDANSTGELDEAEALVTWSASGDASTVRWVTVVVAGRTRVGEHADTFTTRPDC
jgi:type IV pilus modification protein PilV